MYLYERDDWPDWSWDSERIAGLLADVRHKQGYLMGRMEALGFELRAQAELETLTTDVLKSSEIEGEHLNAEQVRSSVARRLGIEIAGLRPADRNVEGVVEMMLDATQHYKPLTSERLFAWHAALFPTGRSGMMPIIIGAWRDDQMQVVSGPIGRERVHYEAPAAPRVPREMDAFLDWFNHPSDFDGVLKAALAHLWFVTIHPMDDGNGRIARAICDMQLARTESSPHRFYSMSAQIREERRDYYDILEHTQRRTMDVTAWMEWFLRCLGRAIDGAEVSLQAILRKARFWERYGQAGLNDRQVLVLNRLLDGFEGKLTTSKYATLAKTSPDTALCDINALMELGILVRGTEGGRSTGYVLADIDARGVQERLR